MVNNNMDEYDSVQEELEQSQFDQFPIVYKVIGSPGSGKTTRVVGNPELELEGLFIENMKEEGYPLSEQMLVTYTNAGVDEAADRLEKMLDKPRSHIDARITTIHSRCFSSLSLDRDSVANSWNKKQFCDMRDIPFSWGSDDEEDIMGGDMKEGNALFQLYGWLQSNRKPLSEWEDCPQDYAYSVNPQTFLLSWEDYKNKNDLVGFGDMIIRCVEKGRDVIEQKGWGTPMFSDTDDWSDRKVFEEARKDEDRDPADVRGKAPFVDTKVMYVDEVQDLTPLQWDWYLMQKLVCEKVYLGGDDDQTIYGWSGADPELMLNEEGDFEVLEQTYRIPEEVWDVCSGVIEQVDVRQEKEVEPAGGGGEFVVEDTSGPRTIIENHIVDNEDDVMVLFRANYMVDEFCESLRDNGIPYKVMGGGSYGTWSDNVVSLRNALAKIENENSRIQSDEMQALKEFADDSVIVEENKLRGKDAALGKLGSGIDAERVKDMFSFTSGVTGGRFDVRRYVNNSNDELNYYQGEALINNIKNGNSDLHPSEVRVGTIHSSKGKEEETVIVGTDTSPTIVENMQEKTAGNPDKTITDAERRVYYVAMTRASNRLVLGEDILGNGGLSIRTLLAEGDEEKGGGMEQRQLDRRSSGNVGW